MVRIEPIKYHLHFIPILAKWHWESWGLEYGIKSAEEAVGWIEEELNCDKLPICYVAIDNGLPVGMCSLASEDGLPDTRKPWLCSLFVVPTCRNQGLGLKLVNHVINETLRLGFNDIYLLTFKTVTKKWYIKLGWQELFETKLNGNGCVVMHKKIRSN